MLGVDLGVGKLAVVSDDTRFDNPKALGLYQRKKARLQRKLARQWEKNGKKPTKNWVKTRAKIGQVDYKIANVRQDAANKASTAIIQKVPKTVVIENLDVKRMLLKEEGETNRRRAAKNRARADAAMGALSRQIEYKAKWHGIEVVRADRYFPSSQICSGCGIRREQKLPLNVRVFRCDHCGLEIDRDLNAARNLAKTW